MAAAMSRSPFGTTVEQVFKSWSSLQLAVDQSFGGPSSREKAEWMVYAVETWFQQNDDIHPDEVEDFLADILNEEFDLIVDDGSLPEPKGSVASGKGIRCENPCQKIPAEPLIGIHGAELFIGIHCGNPKSTFGQADVETEVYRMKLGLIGESGTLCQENKEDEIQSRLQSLPKPSLHNFRPDANNAMTEEMDSDEDLASPSASSHHPHASQASGYTQSPTDACEQMETNPELEEEDGWKVIRKSRRKK